jgi:hypothetical protein
MLQALKVIGLGTLIWLFTSPTIIVWTVGFGIVNSPRLPSCQAPANVDVRAGLPAGLSAIVFSPIPYFIIILAAYGVAYWIVIGRKR